MPPSNPPTRRIPIRCSDRNHDVRVAGGNPPLGFLDWPVDQPGGAAAAWGYVCDTCAGAWHDRRRAFASANAGRKTPDWHLLELTPSPALVD